MACNMSKRITAAILVMLLGIGLMAYAGAELLQTDQIYKEGNSAYEELRINIRGSAGGSSDSSRLPDRPDSVEYSKDTEELEITPIYYTRIHIPEIEINFKGLKEINEDAVAWLYSPGTVIDYPVMQANDYSYYLDRLPDRTYNANGSLFIDYNSASDFSDKLTVIYGHHMRSGAMFGSLKGYKEQSYYDDNPYMYLYTENGNYRITLLYGFVVGAGQWRDRAFMFQENVKSLIAFAEYSATFESSAEYNEGDRLIALSTCSYEFNDARYVVLGILENEYQRSTATS